jgi:penicillin amidase
MRVTLDGLRVAAPLLLRALFYRPRPLSLRDRLAMLPLTGAPLHAPVTIRWNDHQVPLIQAESDVDLATALGIVHIHLRGAQIEAMRRLALSRVSEIVGPLGIELDRAMLLMDLGRAVPAIIDALPPATRDWAEAFLRGVNHAVAHGSRPPELALLDVPRTPWTLTDLFTLARLCAADVSWVVWARLLKVQAKLPPAAWAALWPRLLAAGAPALPGLARSGSNSAAVSARRSAHAAAMIASDPHLSMALPNLWLLAGMKSPGVNAVGMMLPGLPFVALGRNADIAWGGTSLHAASSDLVDVSGQPHTERLQTIPVRGGKPVTLRLRETAFGPIVTDGMLLRSRNSAALRWVGHTASDEMTAMLGVNRARDWTGFTTALTGFAVPGQTMTYADRAGAVGAVVTAHLPQRATIPPATMLDPPVDWAPLASTVPDQARHDPPEGFVASANDQPPASASPVGYFFAGPNRVNRLRQLLTGAPVTLDAMHALQTDMRLPALPRLHAILLPHLRPRTAQQAETAVLIRDWGGRYDAESRGALAYELLVGHTLRILRKDADFARYSAIWTARTLLTEDFKNLPPRLLQPALALALRQATAGLRRFRNWGGAHHLRVAHPLARLPLHGRHFAVDLPSGGSNDTLDKSGHGPVTGRHVATFGSCARHVSDLADPDANEFVLMGGQDGWPGSSTFADQIALWQNGQRMVIPLDPDRATDTYPHVTTLRPA